jgi:hypothetical protein
MGYRPRLNHGKVQMILLVSRYYNTAGRAVAPWQPTIARWINRRRQRKPSVLNPEGDPKWSKVLAHDGPMTQFAYGSNTASHWQRPVQLALICTPGSGTIAVDVDYPDEFAQTRTGALLGRQHAFTVRGERFHDVIDARFVPLEEWPRQGPIAGGDIKSNGWVPMPGSNHYSGDIYQPARWPPLVIPAWPELIAAINADRADHDAASPRTGSSGGNGHGGGEHIGGHDDYLTKKVVYARIMNGLRAGLAISDPRLEQMVKAAWWQAANPPEDPGDPYDWHESWPRFWCQRLRDKAVAEYAAERCAYDAWMARGAGDTSGRDRRAGR